MAGTGSDEGEKRRERSYDQGIGAGGLRSEAGDRLIDH
jgi:hypothetical protein